MCLYKNTCIYGIKLSSYVKTQFLVAYPHTLLCCTCHDGGVVFHTQSISLDTQEKLWSTQGVIVLPIL